MSARVIVKGETEPKVCIRTIGRCVYKIRHAGKPCCVFVPDPSLRGRWLMTDICVIEVACPDCGSVEGVPCRGTSAMAKREYACTVHSVRKRAGQVKQYHERRNR